MLRQVLAVLLEALAGLFVAAAILAVLIPVLIRRNLIRVGDTPGVMVIALVVFLCVAGAVLRPGAALRARRKDRH